jgi:hypothetical protein
MLAAGDVARGGRATIVAVAASCLGRRPGKTKSQRPSHTTYHSITHTHIQLWTTCALLSRVLCDSSWRRDNVATLPYSHLNYQLAAAVYGPCADGSPPPAPPQKRRIGPVPAPAEGRLGIRTRTGAQCSGRPARWRTGYGRAGVLPPQLPQQQHYTTTSTSGLLTFDDTMMSLHYHTATSTTSWRPPCMARVPTAPRRQRHHSTT